MTAAHKVEPPTAEQLVSNATALIPSLRERGIRIAEERRMPEDVYADLQSAGLMELMRPRRYGGQQHTLETVTRVGRELGKGDASVCWAYLVTAAHDCFVDLFPRSVQDEVWGSPNPVGASSYMPTGKVTPTDGGYTLSGKWSFLSGVDIAGWALLGGIVGMLDNPVRPDMRYFLVPKKQFQIIDDWHVMGLRGTGSKSVGLENVFVPNERIITHAQITEGHSMGTDDPKFKMSVWPAIGFSLAAPATGAAQIAFDHTVGDLQARFARRDPVFEAKKTQIQQHVGEASALIETSDMVFNARLESVSGKVARREALSMLDRVSIRRDTCYSILAARRGTELLMSVAGGSGLRESHPVQRCLRDLIAISAHPATGWDSPSTSYGSFILGGPPLEPSI